MKNPTTTNHHTLIAGLLAIALVLCAIGAGTINYTETLDNLVVRTNALLANLVVSGNATLSGRMTNSFTDNTSANSRPVISTMTYYASPSGAISGSTDFHGVDLQMGTLNNGNINSNVKLYPFESTARHWSTNAIGGLVGGLFEAYNASVGTIGFGYALRIFNQNLGSGTYTNLQGVRIENPSNSGGGTIVTNYGLYVEPQTSGANNFDIHAAGNNNYFGAINLKSFTTATLPSGMSNGAVAWSSDVLTPYGTGSHVFTNGSAWVGIGTRIEATTSLRQYMVNAAKAGWVGQSTYDTAFYVSGGYGNGGFPRIGTLSGSASGSDTYTTTTFGVAGYLASATGAAGNQIAGNLYTAPASANSMVWSGANLAPSALCDGTDTFLVLHGFVGADTYGSTNLPTRGVFVFYDRYKMLYTGSATNNWIFATGMSSSWTFTDTGLPVTATTSTPDRLSINWENLAAVCYTNGVVSCTNSANLPSGGCAYNIKFYRSAGSTARNLYFWYPYVHERKATALVLN